MVFAFNVACGTVQKLRKKEHCLDGNIFDEKHTAITSDTHEIFFL